MVLLCDERRRKLSMDRTVDSCGCSEQLEYTIKRTPESRLSCCIPITPELGQWMQSGQGHIALPRF